MMTLPQVQSLFAERFKFDASDREDAAQVWSCFLESLQLDGKISQQQIESWGNPFQQ
jgi:hypothetical protein